MMGPYVDERAGENMKFKRDVPQRRRRIRAWVAGVTIGITALAFLSIFGYRVGPSGITQVASLFGGNAGALSRQLLGRQVEVISLVGTDAGGPSKSTALPQAGPGGHTKVAIDAGDSSITAQNVDTVAHLIQTVSARVLERNLGGLPDTSARVVLFGSEAGYAEAVVKAFGKQNASQVVKETGGFTSGSTVYIPYYKYKDDAFLVNTLTHELTHATLNQAGIGGKLPTWLNEGFAWYDGVQAEDAVNAADAQQVQTTLMKQLTAAKQSGNLQPLSGKASSVLGKHPTYNVEFQDYLAVKALIAQDGIATFDAFLHDIPKQGVDASFQANFGTSLKDMAGESSLHSNGSNG